MDHDAYSSAEAAPWLSPAQDALPPVPLLDSSDALDVVVAAPPRLAETGLCTKLQHKSVLQIKRVGAVSLCTNAS